MNPKVKTALAISAYMARKSLRLAGYIFVGLLLLLLLLLGFLAYNFTAWWWIFLIPIAVACLIFCILYWIINRLTKTIYRHPFSRQQRQALDEFADKIHRLIEAKSIPLPIFGLITLKDIFIHKDAKSIKKLIDDSSSLKSDLRELESYFGHR